MLKKYYGLLFCYCLSIIVQAQDKESIRPERLETYYELAGKSSAQKQHQKALLYLDSALAIAPQYGSLRYERAKLLLVAGKPEEAFSELRLLLRRKQQFVRTAVKDSIFNQHPKFKAFQTELVTLEKPVHTAIELVKLPELDVVPEGVAYDPIEKGVYVSSIYKRKILKITPDKKVSNFTAVAQDNLLSVVGMEVDSQRRHLWVCSSYDPANSIVNGEGLKPQAAIHKLDLKTGKLLKKYTLPESSANFFNDITVLPNGDVYFTDSNVGTVYCILTQTDQIQPLFPKPFLTGANGITKDSHGENLFISSWLRGIIRYNFKTKKWHWLESKDPSAITCGVDGLAYYQGNLIANSPMEINGIVRLKLNQTEDSIQKSELLEYRNPLFGAPTTGEIAGDTFYFIANSGLEAYDRSTGHLDKTKLTPPTILQLKLKPLNK